MENIVSGKWVIGIYFLIQYHVYNILMIRFFENMPKGNRTCEYMDL